MKSLSTILLCLSTILIAGNGYSQAALNYYYGNLHSHTGYSDGSMDRATSGVGNPRQAYNFAKASLHFDFLGISEHNHSTAGMLLPNYHKGLAQADSANEDGTFVTLFGMEWGVISTGGHVLVYGSDELLGWEPNNYDQYVGQSDYAGLWNKINSKPGAFGMLCHPSTSDFDNLKTSPYRPSADQAIVGSAFRSGPAFSTNITYSNQSTTSYESYWKNLLAKGYHVGPTYDHDNHNTTFGRHTEGRLVVLAPTLTRADLMQAFKERRFYASDDWNAEVSVRFYTHHNVTQEYPMGAIVQSPGNHSIFISYSDPDNEPLTSFLLFKGVPGSGQVASQIVFGGPTSLLYVGNDVNPGDSVYYYVVFTQADGDKIITSPIWFTRADPVSAPEPVEEAKKELMIWPNPAMSGSPNVMIATPEAGELYVLDVLGRVVKQLLASATGTTLPLEGLTPGMYAVRYSSSQGRLSTAVLVVQ